MLEQENFLLYILKVVDIYNHQLILYIPSLLTQHCGVSVTYSDWLTHPPGHYHNLRDT